MTTPNTDIQPEESGKAPPEPAWLRKSIAAIRETKGDVDEATAALFQDIASLLPKVTGANKSFILEAVRRGCESMAKEALQIERARVLAENAPKEKERNMAVARAAAERGRRNTVLASEASRRLDEARLLDTMINGKLFRNMVYGDLMAIYRQDLKLAQQYNGRAYEALSRCEYMKKVAGGLGPGHTVGQDFTEDQLQRIEDATKVEAAELPIP